MSDVRGLDESGKITAIYRIATKLLPQLERLENAMGALEDAVAQVDATTNAVLAFLQANNVATLQQALTDAQAALATAQATDATDVAARDAALADVAAGQAAAQAAADELNADSQRLSDAIQPPPAP